MKLAVIKNAITSKVGRQILITQKHSPTIMFVSGVIGVVATAVLASRATLKINDILNEHDETIDKIENFEDAKYSEADRSRDKAIVYFRTGAKLARVYAPAVLIGGLSIAALTGAHVVLNRRYAGAAAAYAALDKGFRAYRERVKNELGVDKEREFMYDLQDDNIVETTADGSVTRTIKTSGSASIYARFFDESNKNWNSTPHLNQFFIKCQQNWANDRLQANGHLFLNEVYDMLGFERTREGAVVGWILGRGGDDHVDFGVFDGDMFAGIRFVNGEEPSVRLDFNVDGIIWDKI